MDAWRAWASSISISISCVICCWVFIRYYVLATHNRSTWVLLSVGLFLLILAVHIISQPIPTGLRYFLWGLWLYALFVAVFYDDIYRARDAV